MLESAIKQSLLQGTVIPAHPLALGNDRKLDERAQRALSRYYLAAGAGGLAVGVHTTQFAIHDPKIGLYEPTLTIAGEEISRFEDSLSPGSKKTIRVAGIIGNTDQAVREASIAKGLGYHIGLLSLAALKGQSVDALIEHCSAVADVIPVFGFYLQPAVGGIPLSQTFWRRFAEIENVVAIKVAAFDRYNTLAVVRGVAEASRADIALYTGNDDNIVGDLVSSYRISTDRGVAENRFVGGLLGHWAVWTRRAVELHWSCQEASHDSALLPELLVRGNEVTDCNAVLFDVANGFAGCVPGIMEVLRRQGLVETNLCLDESEVLSKGQADEITRVSRAYPHLIDDEFVREHLDNWLR